MKKLMILIAVISAIIGGYAFFLYRDSNVRHLQNGTKITAEREQQNVAVETETPVVPARVQEQEQQVTIAQVEFLTNHSVRMIGYRSQSAGAPATGMMSCEESRATCMPVYPGERVTMRRVHDETNPDYYQGRENVLVVGILDMERGRYGLITKTEAEKFSADSWDSWTAEPKTKLDDAVVPFEIDRVIDVPETVVKGGGFGAYGHVASKTQTISIGCTMVWGECHKLQAGNVYMVRMMDKNEMRAVPPSVLENSGSFRITNTIGFHALYFIVGGDDSSMSATGGFRQPKAQDTVKEPEEATTPPSGSRKTVTIGSAGSAWQNPNKEGTFIAVATSSEAIPLFPRALSGYRSENDKDFWNHPFSLKGTIRVFSNDEWKGIFHFPNTMNGCSSGVFMIRWRSANPNVSVQSSVRYSSRVPSDAVVRTGVFGYMSGTNCHQPMFKFGSSSVDSLVDVYYELKFWQAAP
jgi:hypothetical protein